MKKTVPAMTFTRTNSRGEKTIHHVILIEYFNGIPHSALTTDMNPGKYHGVNFWDIDKNANWEGDLMCYKSGGGGYKAKKLPMDGEPVEGSNHSYWVHPDFDIRKKPKNTTKLSEPILLRQHVKESVNPFDIAQEVYATMYCEGCEGMVGDSMCTEHMYENEEDDYNLYYTNTHKPVE